MSSAAIRTTAERDAWLRTLCRAREAFPLPRQAHRRAESFIERVLAFLFPHFAADVRPGEDDVAREFESLRAEAEVLFPAFGSRKDGEAPGSPGDGAPDTEPAGARFLQALPELREALLADATFLVESDPAATSIDEVILAYPGFLATACYRIAHQLHLAGVALLPRLITEHAHQRTGIDIHPGARIGVPFAIDHGTGIVIGETADVGARVRLYQGVTLGALSVEKALADAKRHPTIGDGVVLYANATVLGGRTVVGAGSIIGGNVWVTRSVPERSMVVHRPTEVRSVDEELWYHI